MVEGFSSKEEARIARFKAVVETERRERSLC